MMTFRSRFIAEQPSRWGQKRRTIAEERKRKINRTKSEKKWEMKGRQEIIKCEEEMEGDWKEIKWALSTLKFGATPQNAYLYAAFFSSFLFLLFNIIAMIGETWLICHRATY